MLTNIENSFVLLNIFVDFFSLSIHWMERSKEQHVVT